MEPVRAHILCCLIPWVLEVQLTLMAPAADTYSSGGRRRRAELLFAPAGLWMSCSCPVPISSSAYRPSIAKRRPPGQASTQMYIF